MFLSLPIVFTHGSTFPLIQTRHKMHHFHPCLSAAPASSIPKFRWTELSAVSYFSLSVDCPLLPLYIQGFPLSWYLGSSVSFKKTVLFSDSSLIFHRGQTFLTLFRLPYPFLLFPYFIGKMKAIIWQYLNPRTPFYEICTSSPSTSLLSATMGEISPLEQSLSLCVFGAAFIRL